MTDYKEMWEWLADVIDTSIMMTEPDDKKFSCYDTLYIVKDIMQRIEKGEMKKRANISIYCRVRN